MGTETELSGIAAAMADQWGDERALRVLGDLREGAVR